MNSPWEIDVNRGKFNIAVSCVNFGKIATDGKWKIGLAIFFFVRTGPQLELLFSIGLAVFMFGWNFSQTFIFATPGTIDGTGGATAMAMGLSNLGGALGPILAAPVITRFGLFSVPAITASLVLVGIAFFAPLAVTVGRRESTEDRNGN